MSNNDCPEKKPLTDEYLKKMDAYWRAANYLAAAQLYMLKNPLLREPLTRDQVKKKIVGHWGTVPGQNFIYVHLNRVIKKFDLDLILLSGPVTAVTSSSPIPIWKALTAKFIPTSPKTKRV